MDKQRKKDLNWRMTVPLAVGLAFRLTTFPGEAQTPVACSIAVDDQASPNQVVLTWTGIANHFYGIRTVSDLGQSWERERDLMLLADPELPTVTMNYRDDTSEPRRFYQVVDLDLTWISPGAFFMGSPTNQTDARPSEAPVHEVTISQGFWMGIHEVTQAEYLSLMDTNPSYFSENLRRPVERVTWYDATNYCAQLTARERELGSIPPGYEFRLPTEAEWEYACRAGTSTRFSFGDDLEQTNMVCFAWYLDNGNLQSHAVSEKLPNPWGLHDLHGNLWEWCQDWYGVYSEESVIDPQGPLLGTFRVKRGGSYAFNPADCRSARRVAEMPNGTSTDLGFRVVLAPSGQ